jgi:hypothetical protein
MAEERALDIRRVTSAMDTTRQSIQDTLGELKERVQESADWRHQVGQRPLTSLWVAAACGLVLARILIPAATGARRRPSASAREGRAAMRASPYLSGALRLLGQLGTFSPALALMRRLIRQVSSKSRR